MRNGSCTTRRFYNAFYRWNLANTAQSCRHAFSTTSPRTEIRRAAHAGDRSRAFGNRPIDSEARPSVVSAQDRTTGSKLAPWTQGPVWTSSEKPFDTFKEWEEVIRYRSEAGMLLQIAVPQRALEHLQRQHGQHLENLRESSGARIEIESPTSGQNSEIGSVWLSGAFAQVLFAKDVVHNLKRDPSRWDGRPQSASDRPFDSLRPLEKVIRESTSEGAYQKIEFMVPAEDWTRLVEYAHPAQTAAHLGVTLEANARPKQGRLGEHGVSTRQQIVVAGPSDRVKRMIDKVRGEIYNLRTRRGRDAAQEGARTHYLLLEIPNDPPDIARQVIGTNHRGLRRMNRECGVQNRILDDSSTVKIQGPSKERLEKAKQFLQTRVQWACEKIGVPEKGLQALESGLIDPLLESSVKDEQPPPKQIENGQPPSERNEILQKSTSTVQSTEEAAHKATQPGKRAEHVEKNTRATRLALRAMSHPVVLVTSQFSIDATHVSPEDAIPFSRGVTVSSFNSITLTPRPMISFNIRVPSRTWDAISSMRRFSAHILNATPKGAALAHAFTQPYDRPDEPFWLAQRMGGKISFVSNQNKSAPTIELEGAISAVLVAGLQMEKCVQVGDHMIVVAEVFRVQFPGVENEGEGPAENATGLTYARQGYRTVGEELDVELPDLESLVPVPHAKTPTTDSAALNETAQPPSPSTEEAHDLDASTETDATSAVKGGVATAERAEFDYFEAMEKDNDESDPAASGAQPPFQNEEDTKLPAEEEEYNFGFDQIQNENENDRWNNGNVPVLTEESAGVGGEGPPVADGSDSGESGSGRKDESQKKPLSDANST